MIDRKPSIIKNTYAQTFFSYMIKNKLSVAYDDYKMLPTNDLPPNENPFLFKQNSNKRLFSHMEYLHKGTPKIADFDEFMNNSGTTALLIIKDDTVVYEGYFNDHERSTPQKLFSITKSFTSALIGIAIEQGFIKSVDDNVSFYIPELKVGTMTIKQLLQMDAGIKFKEGHFPWKDEAKVYLHPNARHLALSVREEKESNKGYFHYNDYHLMLLGFILEKTTGITVTKFFLNNIWSKLGMQYPGYMILDSPKHSFEKLESGLVMSAIDLAKFGRLYLQKGEWEGREIIKENWVNESVNSLNVPTTFEHFRYYQKHPWGKMWFRHNKAYYKYLWWGHLNNQANNDFFGLGALGQVLYISPENNSIAIRMGKRWGVMDWWPSILHKLINFGN